MNTGINLCASLFFIAIYLVCIAYLGDVDIRGGNVTSIINRSALLGLIGLGILGGCLLAKHYYGSLNTMVNNQIKGSYKRHLIILILILTTYKTLIFFNTPSTIQFLHIWPDSTGYLTAMYLVMDDPIKIFNLKSPVYTTWLIFNHLTFGQITPSAEIKNFFGVAIHMSDVFAPLIGQNILGIFAACICFSIFSRLGVLAAYTITLLAFLNPTTLAIENAILRESLLHVLFLGGFSLFLKAYSKKSCLYGFASGLCFLLAYQTRPELIIIYFLLFLLYFFQTLINREKNLKPALSFVLPLIIAVALSMLWKVDRHTISKSKGQFDLIMHGLKSKCYSYNSLIFPELIRKIEKRIIQCREERFAPCDAPNTTMFVFKNWTDEEVTNFIVPAIEILNSYSSHKKDGNHLGWETIIQKKYQINNPIKLAEALNITSETISPALMRKRLHELLFFDIVQNNTACYINSTLTNWSYFLVHNLQNTTTVLYSGNNPLITKNWNYFTSPKVLDIYDPGTMKLSSPNFSRINFLFSAHEPYVTRKVLAPFFFIGTFLIFMAIKKKTFQKNGDASFFVTSLVLISWSHITLVSVIADPVARFIHVNLPFLFGIEIIGLLGVFFWVRSTWRHIPFWITFWKLKLQGF